jgi:hypothetical protein
MAKFIKTIVDRINLATKKGLVSYWTPEQIATEVHTESMNIWDKYLSDFENNNKLDEYMRPFQQKESVVLTSGIGTIVTKDYIYYVEDADTGNEIKNIDDQRWGYRKNHSVKVPTVTYPICNISNQGIQVLPSSIVNIKIWYIKKPTKPVYAYTVSSGRYVYDDSSSIDFEWNETLHDRIMNRVLGNLGISIRDFDMVNKSDRDKMTEGT